MASLRCVAGVLIALVALISYSQAQDNCQGKPNYNPIFTSKPVFVNSTSNGKLFLMKDVSPPLSVVHVYGQPYDMGFAQGQLIGPQIRALVPQFYQYVYDQVWSGLVS
jgi:isopenicillin-N N-acyltransferase like protein